ncbi:sugar phosphate isomerase/epimerase family protein [Paenibacillus sp. MBLB4367]|uniref:sugar phosphate isomerase/epimerase family protein n=1 Tax=Paenibacillus sp. MBLB4367 TaxID=3384767 RepID=UPI0039080C69
MNSSARINCAAWKNPFIWTMGETLDWIAAIGEPNVGLLLDAYHWYTTDGTVEDLLALKPEQIVHVHINDAKPIPVEDVLDNDRLYPGEGAIDLASFLKAISQIGYKGVVAQEFLTRQAPAQTSEELLRRSADAYRNVYAAAGLA